MHLLTCRQARSYHLCREATAMILGDVFGRFAQDSPLSVMARGVLENALNPQVVDTLFEDVADKLSIAAIASSDASGGVSSITTLLRCCRTPPVRALGRLFLGGS